MPWPERLISRYVKPHLRRIQVEKGLVTNHSRVLTILRDDFSTNIAQGLPFVTWILSRVHVNSLVSFNPMSFTKIHISIFQVPVLFSTREKDFFDVNKWTFIDPRWKRTGKILKWTRIFGNSCFIDIRYWSQIDTPISRKWVKPRFLNKIIF